MKQISERNMRCVANYAQSDNRQTHKNINQLPERILKKWLLKLTSILLNWVISDRLDAFLLVLHVFTFVDGERQIYAPKVRTVVAANLLAATCFQSFYERSTTMKKIATITGALALVFSASAFAQSGSINIPGIGSASGSSGSEVKNSTINIMKNKSNKVNAGGGSAGGFGVSANLSGQANVNSVQLTNSKITDSKVNVMENESGEVTAIGGQANVNSLQLQ